MQALTGSACLPKSAIPFGLQFPFLESKRINTIVSQTFFFFNLEPLKQSKRPQNSLAQLILTFQELREQEIPRYKQIWGNIYVSALNNKGMRIHIGTKMPVLNSRYL